MPEARVNGVRLYYELRGPEEGEPLVFVNGLLTDTNSWAQHVPAFEDRYRILLYDARGQGRSEKPPGPYPIRLHAQDLAALLDLLQIKQANCVGLSNGGAALLSLAIERPDLVKRLIIADGYSHVDAILEAKLEAWVAAAKISSELRFLVATPYVWSNRFLEENRELFGYFKERAAQFPKEAAVNLIAGAKEQDVSDRLGEIRAPTLIVVGEEDILTPVKHARFMHERIPNSQLYIIPEAGHASPIERPELFNRVVREFLEEA
jgi:3-oxoadipate enol-lactonase